jgi:hypothetical protein
LRITLKKVQLQNIIFNTGDSLNRQTRLITLLSSLRFLFEMTFKLGNNSLQSY